MHSIVYSRFFLTAVGAELLNVPQLFDNSGPASCQIVECFSLFDNIGSIWSQIVGSTASIRQFWPPRGAVLLNSECRLHPKY